MSEPNLPPAGSRSEQQLAERRARRFWVSLVVLLLGLQVVVGGVALKLATGDAAAAIVPNYHQAALDWDQTHRQRTAADRLGWNVDLNISDVADGRGFRAVQVAVRDRDGTPVDQLNVSALIYHHARAAETATVSMDQVGRGSYRMLAAMQREGLWQVDLNFRQGDELITVQRIVEL